jgi:ABC-2 type transport system permease protein
MRIWALIRRICQQMLRDKRTLALLFVAPLFILTLMYFFFNGNAIDPKLGVVNVETSFVEALAQEEISVIHYEQVNKEIIVDDDLDGLLNMKDGKWQLILKNSDPGSSKSLQIKVTQSIALHMQSQIPNKNAKPIDLAKHIDTDYVYGNSETEYFDVLSPVLIGFFVFFFVFLISGIGLLKERTSGTLEKILSTPIKRGEIVSAYLVGYGIFAIIQTVIVVLYSIHLLNVVLVGSIWNVILINLLLALVALSLGILLSTFAASEFQMVQFIPIAVIPQIFFAGIFPVEGMADWLQSIGRIMPLFYAADALKGVMYKGYSLNEISGELLALFLFAVVFIILNIFALKRYRKL